MDIIQMKESVPFLSHFDDQDLYRILRFSRQVSFETSTFLFQQNEPSDGVYFIYSGKVEVFVTDNSRKVLKLLILPEGSIVGEIGFMDKKNRTASVRALENTKALALYRDEFSRLEELYPTLSLKIRMELGKVVAERIRICDKLLVNHSMIKINENFMLNLSKKFVTPNPQK